MKTTIQNSELINRYFKITDCCSNKNYILDLSSMFKSTTELEATNQVNESWQTVFNGIYPDGETFNPYFMGLCEPYTSAGGTGIQCFKLVESYTFEQANENLNQMFYSLGFVSGLLPPPSEDEKYPNGGAICVHEAGSCSSQPCCDDTFSIVNAESARVSFINSDDTNFIDVFIDGVQAQSLGDNRILMSGNTFTKLANESPTDVADGNNQDFPPIELTFGISTSEYGEDGTQTFSFDGTYDSDGVFKGWTSLSLFAEAYLKSTERVDQSLQLRHLQDIKSKQGTDWVFALANEGLNGKSFQEWWASNDKKELKLHISLKVFGRRVGPDTSFKLDIMPTNPCEESILCVSGYDESTIEKDEYGDDIRINGDYTFSYNADGKMLEFSQNPHPKEVYPVFERAGEDGDAYVTLRYHIDDLNPRWIIDLWPKEKRPGDAVEFTIKSENTSTNDQNEYCPPTEGWTNGITIEFKSCDETPSQSETTLLSSITATSSVSDPHIKTFFNETYDM